MHKNTHNVIDLESFLPYRLSVLEQRISHAISEQYQDRFGLNRMQWRVLSTLALFDGISARDICKFTHMEKMQASRAISGLLDAGLLSQAINPSDQRAQLLSLTDQGRSVYRQIAPAVTREAQRIFSSLSAQELETFGQLVDKLCNSLGTC